MEKEDVENAIANIDDFEQFIADFKSELGWETEVTQQGPDKGIDIIARRNESTRLIQVKQWSQKPVTSEDVQQYLGLLEQVPEADQVEIITTSRFTDPAREVVNQASAILVDGSELTYQIIDTNNTKILRDITNKNERMSEDEENGLIGIGDATEIAQEYIEEHRDDEWERVIDTQNKSNSWKIVFLTSESNAPQTITVDKETANIVDTELLS